MRRNTVNLWLLLVMLAACSARGADVELDSVMYDDPRVPPPPTQTVFPSRLRKLWMAALARPEADMKSKAAESIVRAHRLGMPKLADSPESPHVVDALIANLEAADQHPVARLAAARALVQLDARRAAPLLFQHATEDGLAMAQIAEPALARWNYEPIREVWLQRLDETHPSRQRLLLAIRGLAVVDEKRAVGRLREMALDRFNIGSVRLAAARAVGQLQAQGLEEAARQLSAEKSPAKVIDRLVAVALLATHDGQSSRQLLLEMARDGEPSVAAIALRRLLEIDTNLVVPIAADLLINDDEQVRYLAAQSLVEERSVGAVQQLGPLLDDASPLVRNFVRRSLIEIARSSQSSLRDAVIAEMLTMLSKPIAQWRGLEQAAIMAAELDHKPAAGRLVELMDEPRAEVFTTAAWSLRRLAVESTLPAMLEKATSETRISQQRGTSPPRGELVSQLFQTFGQLKYMQADDVMRKYVPEKNGPYALSSREAAIWALGHLHADKEVPAVASAMRARLDDVNSLPPEFEEVRRMCAVSLGRMKSLASVDSLKQAYSGPNNPTGYACGWALHQIDPAAHAMPRPRLETKAESFWFLQPLGFLQRTDPFEIAE